jgi:putative transposase
VFVDEEDRSRFIALLIEQAQRHRVALHAWALMSDHLHLLLTPQEGAALSPMIQGVGRVYVPAFNRRHGHRGSLWEGRFRSTVLQADVWCLPAMVWMDSHPHRSGLATGLSAHPWTSAGHYLGLHPQRGLTTPPQYWALGNTPFAREAAYRTLLEQGCDEAMVQALTQASLKAWALGSVAFVAELQKNMSRRLRPNQPGRPVRRVECKP